MKTAKKLSSLRISVMGLNEINKYVADQLTSLLPQIRGYIGEKITLSGGDLAAKFKVNSPGQVKEKKKLYFLNNHGWFSPSASSLWVHFKTCINGGSYDDRTAFTEYFEHAIYLGEIKDQVLISVKSLDEIVKDYELNKTLTVEDMTSKINDFEQAKSEAEMILKTIPEHIQRTRYLKK